MLSILCHIQSLHVVEVAKTMHDGIRRHRSHLTTLINSKLRFLFMTKYNMREGTNVAHEHPFAAISGKLLQDQLTFLKHLDQLDSSVFFFHIITLASGGSIILQRTPLKWKFLLQHTSWGSQCVKGIKAPCSKKRYLFTCLLIAIQCPQDACTHTEYFQNACGFCRACSAHSMSNNINQCHAYDNSCSLRFPKIVRQHQMPT